MPSTLTGRRRLRPIVAACSVVLLAAGRGGGSGANGGTGGNILGTTFFPSF